MFAPGGSFVFPALVRSIAMDGRRKLTRATLLTVGIACIIASVAVIAIPLYGVWSRNRADTTALDSWNKGGSQALIGVVPGAPQRTTAHCGSGSTSDYALVTFPTLAKYGYAGVAGDGNWDELTKRSMVHFTTSPAPGQKGNVIIAFHREPDYEHIDELKAGDTVTVQDKQCVSFNYRISKRFELDPSRVTQLGNTDGHELTLITCTPWFQDQRRYVWRAELIA